MSIYISKVFNDRYKIIRLIGRGGMADVYLGKDLVLDRDVAVKILRSDLCRDSGFRKRFHREAQSAGSLDHEGIVGVYDFGEENKIFGEENILIPFIVMEYVVGTTVRSLIKSKKISIKNSLKYVVGILNALDYSHSRNIVHRDIKPANVMITSVGKTKVMDFGISRTVSDSAATMTQTKSVIGTAQYLSPEQARGDVVDFRSDLYSTGCLLYEQLTGRPPFVGDSQVSIAYQHVKKRPLAPSFYNSKISKTLDSVVLKSLSKNPKYRYQNAADFKKDIVNIQLGKSVSSSKSFSSDIYSSSYSVKKKRRSLFYSNFFDVIRKKKMFFSGIFVVMLSIFLGFVTVHRESNFISVPDFSNMEIFYVENQLKELNISYEIKNVNSNEFDFNHIIKTSPDYGKRINNNSTLTIFVSLGSQEVVIPNMHRSNIDEATKILENMGIIIDSIERVNHPNIPANQVISSEPNFEDIVSSNHSINLKVSNGMLVLPNFVGRNLDEVIKNIQEQRYQLKVEIEYIENTILDENIVTRQSIPINKETPQNSILKLYVTVRPELSEEE